MTLEAIETDLSIVKTIAGLVAIVFPPAGYIADAAGVGIAVLQHLDQGKALLASIEAAVTPGGGGVTQEHIATAQDWMDAHKALMARRAMGQHA